MKNIFLILASMFLITTVNAQTCCNKTQSKTKCDNKTTAEVNATSAEVIAETISFKVLGNCDMCKVRIEEAALTIDGVSTANWSSSTGFITVGLSKEVNPLEINKAVANVGHDTDLYKADNSVYDKLPGCCKYER